MGIFKCLYLKALSTLQDHEGGGRDGITKIITQGKKKERKKKREENVNLTFGSAM